MDSAHTLLRRSTEQLSAATLPLLIVLLVLVCVSVICGGILLFIRRRRQALKNDPLLPQHSDEKLTVKRSNHRRLSGITISSTIPFSRRRSQPLFVEQEKQEFVKSTSSPPASPLPQIRITFPEEVDEAGQTQSGRVVVLHVGDKGEVGMEPCHEDEKLPPYSNERFVSLDLDRMGGLKEKHVGLF